MRTLHYTTTLVLMVLCFSLKAAWPGNSSFLTKEREGSLGEHKITTSIFAWQKKKQRPEAAAFEFSTFAKVDQAYVTGLTKKAEDDMTRVLNWNFKVKFRLNRNLNIIFSYN